MRVLHIIESMGPGGAERHLANLLAPLAALGIENSLVTLWPGNAYEPQVMPYLKQWHRLDLPDRQAFPALPSLYRYAKEADILHTQLPWADIAGRLAGLAADKPVVSTLQSTWYADKNLSRYPKQRPVRWQRRIEKLTSGATDHFFAVSEATRDAYCESIQIPRQKIEVLPNTVDLQKFDATKPKTSLRKALGLAPHDIVILSVGRLVPQKGHAASIRALAPLARTFPVRLLIAGTGPEEESLRALANELSVTVNLLGVRSDIPDLLSIADIFLHNSLFEGLPLALIEAMAMGCCCLASDVVENREAGGDAILYAEETKLSSQLALLCQDEALRKQLRESAKRYALRYDAWQVAFRFVHALYDVLAKRAQR